MILYDPYISLHVFHPQDFFHPFLQPYLKHLWARIPHKQCYKFVFGVQTKEHTKEFLGTHTQIQQIVWRNEG